jgi:steroid 5-alpha reductase family enzyme
MFAVHGTRLAWHLAARIVGEPEEGRYVELRRTWGESGSAATLNLKFLGFFLFQAALNVFLAVPLALACLDPTPRWRALEWVGAAVWLAGLVGEARADAQLAAFRRDPAHRGAVCDRGLWRYSRHPNYFFEWLMWIGYALFALASPYGWVSLAMPLLMLHFLLNVTGIKATEAQALRSRGEHYRIYQARTSPFVPWFPRKGNWESTP